MKTILVTGANGYLGQAFLNHSATFAPDARWWGLVRGTPTQPPQGWHPVVIDLFDSDLADRLELIQPHVILHAAAAPKTTPLEYQLRTNVVGTEYLYDALRKAQLSPKVIILGSAAEYGLSAEAVCEATCPKPLGSYGVSKLAQVQTALNLGRQYDIPTVVGRIFNVYGHTPPTLAIASLATQIVQLEATTGKPGKLTVQNLLSQRDFIHVDDVCRGLWQLAQTGQRGEIYNIASGQPSSLKTVLDVLLAFSTLPKTEWVTEGPQFVDCSWADISKLKTIGWSPEIPLVEGLKSELTYWRNQQAQPLVSASKVDRIIK